MKNSSIFVILCFLFLIVPVQAQSNQVLINIPAQQTVCGNEFSAGCMTNSQYFTLGKLKEQGFKEWKLAAEMEARFSWLGAIHAMNAPEIAKLAGHPREPITVVIGEKDKLTKKYGKLLAEATCEETRKTVQIWSTRCR